jgi:hypothetical protein
MDERDEAEASFKSALGIWQTAPKRKGGYFWQRMRLGDYGKLLRQMNRIDEAQVLEKELEPLN